MKPITYTRYREKNVIVYAWPDRPRTVKWFVDTVKRCISDKPNAAVQITVLCEESEKAEAARKRLGRGWVCLFAQEHINPDVRKHGVGRVAFLPPNYEREAIPELDLYTPRQLQRAGHYDSYRADAPKRRSGKGTDVTKNMGKTAKEKSRKIYKRLVAEGRSNHHAIIRLVYEELNGFTPAEYIKSKADGKQLKQVRSIERITRHDVVDMKQ